MEIFPKTKNQDLKVVFLLVIMVAGWGRIKKNENDWKFNGYKGTNLGYDMLCESLKLYQEEKEGHLLNGNCIINLKNLITNIDHILVYKEYAQEREL